MNPAVSIIVPCYNIEKYVERLLTSLTEQTIGLENLEIILVDDASTDNTYSLLCDWERKFPDSILVVHSDVNRKQGGARNIGVNYANGKYITFVDADDWVEAEMCEVMFEKAEEYQTDMVICTYDCPKDTGEVVPGPAKKEELVLIDSVEARRKFVEQYRTNSTCWGIFFNRSWFCRNEISFPENLFYEDNIMFMVYALARKIYVLNEPYYHYFQSTQSTIRGNRNPLDRIKVFAMIYPRLCEKEFDDIRDLAEFQCYDKAFAESVFHTVSLNGSMELLQYLKDILLKWVPNICTNAYYARDFALPRINMELLLHPLVEKEITQEDFARFFRREAFCRKFPKILYYLEQLLRIRRKIVVSQNTAENCEEQTEQILALLELCKNYSREPFAKTDAVACFSGRITTMVVGKREKNKDEWLRLIDNFSMEISED